MSQGLQISVELRDQTAVLSLSGELDAVTVSSLVELVESVEPHDFGRVVLDLAELEHLDAGAAHALLTVRDELHLRLQQLECRNAHGEPAMVLQMSGVGNAIAAR